MREPRASQVVPDPAIPTMPRFHEVLPDLFEWTDTCNVYVLRDGDAALLIDLGDGSVLEHLGCLTSWCMSVTSVRRSRPRPARRTRGSTESNPTVDQRVFGTEQKGSKQIKDRHINNCREWRGSPAPQSQTILVLIFLPLSFCLPTCLDKDRKREAVR